MLKNIYYLISLIIITIILISPTIFYFIEFIFSIAALFFLLLSKRKSLLFTNLFPYLFLILIDHIVGAGCWILADLHLLNSFNFSNFTLSFISRKSWIFSIMGGLSLPLTLEYTMKDSIQFTTSKKIIGLIGFILSCVWFLVKDDSTNLWILTYVFVLSAMIAGFFKSISNYNPQKLKIRKIIIKFIGSYLILCTLQFVASIIIKLMSWNYWYDYIISNNLSAIQAYLVLSFITIIFIIGLKKRYREIKIS